GDGIRDRNVTGVQTCALPSSGRASSEERGKSRVQRPKGTADSSEETSSSSSSSSSDARSQPRDERPAETTGTQDEDTGAFKCDEIGRASCRESGQSAGRA